MESVLARPCGIHACLHSGHVALSKLSFLARGLSFQFPFRFPVMVDLDFFSTTLLHDLQPNYTLYPPKMQVLSVPSPTKISLYLCTVVSCGASLPASVPDENDSRSNSILSYFQYYGSVGGVGAFLISAASGVLSGSFGKIKFFQILPYPLLTTLSTLIIFSLYLDFPEYPPDSANLEVSNHSA